MNKIAIDIVLLPSDEVNNLAFELNKKTDQSKLKFGKSAGEATPHITLAMAVIAISDISKLGKDLEALYKKHLPLELKLSGTSGGEIEGEGYIWGIDIEKNDRLWSLHEEAMNILKKYSSQDFDNVDFVDKGNLEWELNWVKEYREKHSAYDKYSPHITIGIGEEEKVGNIEFEASALALYQLGKFCTCKKILESYS